MHIYPPFYFFLSIFKFGQRLKNTAKLIQDAFYFSIIRSELHVTLTYEKVLILLCWPKGNPGGFFSLTITFMKQWSYML